MRTNAIGTRENMKVIDTGTHGGVQIDVLEYQKLSGASNPYISQKMYFMEKQNIKARQIVIYINNDSVEIEPGAMSYFQGNLEMESGVTPGNAIGRIFSSATTGESIAQPKYKGTGMLVLEPSFQHFLVLDMEDEEIVVDKGMFYCAQGGVNVSPYMLRNVSSALLGGEGFFQISLKGTGLVVLQCPVPASEIDIIELNNDTLKVDGSFSILRSGSIQFTVERSSKSLIGSAVSGEGLVNVYRGTGSVWLAPSVKIYQTLGALSLSNNLNMNTSSNRNTR